MGGTFGRPGNAAIHVVDAGKRYVKYDDVPTLVGLAKRLRSRKRHGDFWAVRHLALEVAPGDTVGIIGRNGAGKTTTLRMLAGVTAPTEGVVAVRGRVSPLIAVGVGFHQELTGRENVYVNGTVLGMTRREIARLFDDIVAFAEIEHFIDTPVKFYSSGMLVRLGFSVAVAARPEVLLVDEILAVGDLPFQLKCYARMAEIQAAGTSIVVVSHNLPAVRRLCSRAVVMDAGEPRFVGPTMDALSAYHLLLEERESEHGADTQAAIRIVRTELLDASGQPTTQLAAGEEAVVRIHADVIRPVEEPVLAFSMSSDAGLLVYQDSTFSAGLRPFEAGERVSCDIRFPVKLPTGSYTVQGIVAWGLEEYEKGTGGLVSFYVVGRPLVFGMADLEASFALSNRSDSVEDSTPTDSLGGQAGEARVDVADLER
jgi:ABC-type polysaccharide/polyol phosphate transport system ATPase subunit